MRLAMESESDQRKTRRQQAGGAGTDLPLAAPVAEILPVVLVDAAVELDTLALTDEHTARRDDVDHRRAPGRVEREPDSDRDVVPGRGVGDGQRAVQAEQEERPAVIEG